MCGIAGILNREGSPLGPEVPARLAHMARQLARRGPDEERTHCQGPMGFIFRRLSIVDLSGGSQPMTNEDGTLHLMVNGEIYNHLELRRRLEGRHTFRSRSDSESEGGSPLYGRSAARPASAGSHTAERQKAASALRSMGGVIDQAILSASQKW